MSKIETGCKAIVVGGRCEENYGKIVTVGAFVGCVELETPIGWIPSGVSDLWEVDQPLVFRNINGCNEHIEYYASECTLQRIDDHDIQLMNEKEEIYEEV